MNDEPPVLGPGPAPPTAGAPPVTAPPTPLPPDATLEFPPLPATAMIGAAPACDALLPPAEGPPSLASCAPQARQNGRTSSGLRLKSLICRERGAPPIDAVRKNSASREARGNCSGHIDRKCRR